MAITHRVFRILPIIALLLITVTFFSCGKGKHSSIDTHVGRTAPTIIQLNHALAELDWMQAPEGVDTVLFKQLKAALRAALIARGSNKITCTPPSGAVNHIPGIALNDVGGGMCDLVWRYYNVGDYNQDGVVGIADITPLAMHFGQTHTVAETDTLPAVVDGSGDGTVNIADVTPIAMNFGVECASYEVQSSDAETGTFALVDTVYLNTGTGKDAGRMLFTYNFAPTPALWYRVTACDGASSAGEGSGAVQAPGPAGLPVADIQADRNIGYAPFTVNFDASASNDPDGGSIVTYEWDAEGDGVFEANTGTTSTYQAVYPTVGNYNATVKVTDDEADQDTALVAIGVLPAPDYDEAENNDMPDSSATPLPPIPFENFTGSVGEELPTYVGYDGDATDFFSFDASVGDTLTFVMEWNSPYIYGYLAILDSDGDMLQSVDLENSPAQITYTFADGDTAPYYLQVYIDAGYADYTLKGVEGAPPTASLIANPKSGPAPLTVNFDASGSTDVASYAWDYLGDGNQVSGNANENYEYASDGWHRATVYVTDADGLTDSASVLITAGDVGYDELEDNDVCDAGFLPNVLPPIPFTGFQGSIGDNPPDYIGYDGDVEDYYYFYKSPGDTVTITLDYDSDTSDPTLVLYDGDRNALDMASGSNPLQIIYTFTVVDPTPYYVDVYDSQGGYSDYTLSIKNGAPPVAEFTAVPTEGAAPLSVDFDGTGSYDPDGGGIQTWEWDWEGDGTFDTFGPIGTITHIFSSNGLYKTTLRVWDYEGDSDTASIWIFVPNAQAYYDEDEPNQDVATANQLPPFPFASWHGSVGYNNAYNYVGYDGGGDDCLLIPSAVGAGDTVHFTVIFDPFDCDMNIALWDSASNMLTVDGNQTELHIEYTFTGTEVFPCYLNMRNVGGDSGGDYWVSGQIS
jgi:PKD repeat protein